jgi:hypothetical protein
MLTQPGVFVPNLAGKVKSFVKIIQVVINVFMIGAPVWILNT